LAAADVVVSRAGASILGEYPLMGLPAILIPYPHAWRYQKVNADYLVEQGAAVRLDDERLGDELWPTLEGLLGDEARWTVMRERALALARPDAAANLVAQLLALAGAA
jgi:UDP-N-acetylglucosamine:LPS N-acetylglucosamine transferase